MQNRPCHRGSYRSPVRNCDSPNPKLQSSLVFSEHEMIRSLPSTPHFDLKFSARLPYMACFWSLLRPCWKIWMKTSLLGRSVPRPVSWQISSYGSCCVMIYIWSAAVEHKPTAVGDLVSILFQRRNFVNEDFLNDICQMLDLVWRSLVFDQIDLDKRHLGYCCFFRFNSPGRTFRFSVKAYTPAYCLPYVSFRS